jgi:hypothetical protein
MLMPREPLRERLARRMTEQKEAKTVAAAKQRKRRARSEEEATVDDQRAVKDELRAVDQHAAVLKKQIAKRPEAAPAFGLWGDERTHEHETRIPRMKH